MSEQQPLKSFGRPIGESRQRRAERPGPPASTLGVILAGGLARRMGGRDKILLEVGGVSILEREIRTLAGQCEALLLNANGDPARFASFRLPVVADPVPDRPGPLAGILAALDWAAENRPDLAYVATAAGDTPFLPADLVARLHLERQRARAELACARSRGRLHPLHGLWPVTLRDELREALRNGQRQVRPWMEARSLAPVDWPAGEVDPFFNANDEAELAEADRLAAIVDQARNDS